MLDRFVSNIFAQVVAFIRRFWVLDKFTAADKVRVILAAGCTK
jgi:hypothetical protein